MTDGFGRPLTGEQPRRHVDARLAEHERVKAKVHERALDLAAPVVDKARHTEDTATKRALLDAATDELRGFELGWIAARPDDYQAVTAGVEAARQDLRLGHR